MIIAVVGAGPCGLFSSLRLLETYPSAVVHLFEATDHIGGRTVMSRYHGVPVVTGITDCP